jgi:hypothetical protein
LTTINFTFVLTPSTPADVTNFNIAIVGSAATLSWDPVLGDPDLSHYVIRYSSDLVTPLWNNSSILIPSIPAKSGSAIVVSLVGSYLIKAVDLQGYESNNASIISTTIAILDTINVISTHNETALLGAKVNCGVGAGILYTQGNSARAWSTMSDVVNMAYGSTNSLLGITDKDPLHTVASDGTVTLASLSGWRTFRAPVGISRGKWYWEIYCSSNDISANYAAYQMVGVSEAALNVGYPSLGSNPGPAHMYYGATGLSYGNGSTGQALLGGVSRPWAVLNTGPYTLGIAFNADIGLVEYYLNNEYQGAIPTNLPRNSLVFPTVSQYAGWAGVTQSALFNFGSTAYKFTPPIGYLSLTNGVMPKAYYYFRGIQDTKITTDTSPSILLTNNGLTIQTATTTPNSWHSARANIGVSKGKWYWEVSVTQNCLLGISQASHVLTNYCGSGITGYSWRPSIGQRYNNGVATTTTGYPSKDLRWLIGVCLDLDTNVLIFYYDGMYITEAAIASGTYYPTLSVYNSVANVPTDDARFNFGANGFMFNPPEGFEPLVLPTIDLGVNTTSRTITDISYTPHNILNLAVGWSNMASISEFSGTAAADASALIEVSTSLDTFTWAPWAPLVAASFTTRYYKLRVKLLSTHSIDTPLVSLINAVIDMPDVTQAGNNIASSSTIDTTCVYSFHEVPAIAIAGQNMATGDYYSITSKTSSGFTVNFYNSSNIRISRIFDWVAKGY